MSLFAELKRRNVHRVGIAYLAAAWLIFQVAESVLPVLGYSDGAVRTVLAVLAIGFVPALIAAWVFELTPDGLRLDADIEPGAPSSRRMQRRLDRIILVVLALAVALFGFDKFVLDPARDEAREQQVAEQARTETIKGFYGDRSIAVLPFVNLSSDPEQEYFADGISEEILNLLANIRELRVISRSSAFTFKGQDIDVPEIAERLNVAHILEGSVRKSGNRIRVTAQLIAAGSDTHLWSENYDRDIGDIFDMQDDIAAKVAAALRIQLLSPLPKSRVTDPQVVALTAQAKQLNQTRPPDVGLKAHALLSEALSIDPNYVPALEWMITANWNLEGEDRIDSDEYLRRRAELIVRIRAIEPDNATAYAIEAWDAAFIENDFESAARLFEKAVLSNPADSNVVRIAGRFAYTIGDFENAYRLLNHAVSIDPLCFQCLYQLSRAYFHGGNYEMAEMTRERYLPLGSGGRLHYGLMMIFTGRVQEAIDMAQAERARTLDATQADMLLAIANYELGNIAEAERYAAKVVAGDESWQLIPVAGIAAWLGDHDRAFELLFEIAAREDSVNFLSTKSLVVHDPALRSLHDDPRWVEWRELMGMSEARLAAIDFNPVLPGDE